MIIFTPLCFLLHIFLLYCVVYCDVFFAGQFLLRCFIIFRLLKDRGGRERTVL